MDGRIPAASAASIPTEQADAAVVSAVEMAFVKGATAGVLAALDDEPSAVLTARIAAAAKAYAEQVRGK